jgi:hypothetical protein
MADRQAARDASVRQVSQQVEHAAADSEASNPALQVQLAAACQRGIQPPQQPGQGAGASAWKVPAGGWIALAPPPLHLHFAAFQAQIQEHWSFTCIRVVPLDSVFIPPFSEVTRDVTAAQVLKLFSPYVKIRNTPPCGDLGHKDGKAYPGRIRATAPPAASSAR